MPIELPMRFEGERLLWTIDDVYTPRECREFVDKIERRLVGLNERLRFYRYSPGQRFPPHTDHWYWPSATRVTLHTVLVYFNDGFEGGETRFIEHLEEVVAPRAGRIAVFQHKLRHEGCAIRSGVKYAMRTDVIYEGDEAIVRPGGG